MLIDQIIKETCKELIAVYHGQSSRSSFIYPCYRNGDIRISEQEARFAFVEAIARRSGYAYSVETPTMGLYSFSGQGSRSACVDLTLFESSALYMEPNDHLFTKFIDEKFKDLELANKVDVGPNRMANIEFKSHNVNQEYIDKDIEKLVIENGIWPHPRAIWFHLFKSTDQGTLASLFDKFNKAIISCFDRILPTAIATIGEITFVICSLEDKRAMMGSVTVGDNIPATNLVDFFERGKSQFFDASMGYDGWNIL